MELVGWVELGGRKCSPADLQQILASDPGRITRFGGEFFLTWNGCLARDHYGIIPGDCPPGTILCNGHVTGSISPWAPQLPLDAALMTAVQLRCDEGITAFSGGIDSSLVASLAGLPCIAIGYAGSHDLVRAKAAASLLNLSCEYVTIQDRDVVEALARIAGIIPRLTPLDTSIAITQYCISRWAGEHGYRRILSGQGADELFGGYARYLRSANLRDALARDFTSLPLQISRDQAVAALHRTCLSLPYMDIRVVRAAQAIPASEMVRDGIRKWPLRTLAARHIPPEIAFYEKKAMQYGTGVWKALSRLARKNGFKRSVQGYINHIGWLEHGNH